MIEEEEENAIENKKPDWNISTKYRNEGYCNFWPIFQLKEMKKARDRKKQIPVLRNRIAFLEETELKQLSEELATLENTMEIAHYAGNDKDFKRFAKKASKIEVRIEDILDDIADHSTTLDEYEEADNQKIDLEIMAKNEDLMPQIPDKLIKKVNKVHGQVTRYASLKNRNKVNRLHLESRVPRAQNMNDNNIDSDASLEAYKKKFLEKLEKKKVNLQHNISNPTILNNNNNNNRIEQKEQPQQK